MLCLTTNSRPLRAQTTSSGKVYQQLTQNERSEFVASQARRIASDLSGRDYEFTPAFIEDIQQALNQYSRRIGNDGDAGLGKHDLRLVLERGQALAPTLIAAFKARNVSPLIGLYLPWIESGYENIQTPNSLGAIGMFQFLPKRNDSVFRRKTYWTWKNLRMRRRATSPKASINSRTIR